MNVTAGKEGWMVFEGQGFSLPTPCGKLAAVESGGFAFMTTTSVNLRIHAGTKERLERLARATKRSKSDLVEAAIVQFLDENEWQLKEIEEGIKEIEEGRTTPHDEVVAVWEAKNAGSVD